MTTGEDPAARFVLEPVFQGRRRVLNQLGIALWLAAWLYFWVWWLDPGHIETPLRFIAVTIVLLWMTLAPAFFIFIFHGARIPSGGGPPPGARVAIVVAKAPSEPFAIARRTLEAALAQEGCDHDTWLADEDPDLETWAWCLSHGVMISTRRGLAAYHRETWPRRRDCKEGNLAYFYDRHGYDRYDFVSQFDVDHVPEPDYLRRALAPFSDPAVGYVSAPSICDANAEESWAARGRLYLEASMHGALQAGYNGGWAPLCIGSHYCVRTAALRSIGGLGPELAEDHSTTLMLNAKGWKGVHAVEAIAHGRGPETFADLVIQEFQWSRSLVTILIKHTPRRLKALSPRLRFQFLFSQLWYPSFSLVMALAYGMPIVAVLTGSRFVNVTYVAYALHILPLSAVLLGLAYWWRSTGLFRPPDARIVSWEGVAFLFLRWPWSLLGSLAAIWDAAAGRRVDFRITPKGAAHAGPVPFRLIAPYVVLGSASAACAWLVTQPGTAAGFYIFNLINAAANLALIVMILTRHARENHRPLVALNLTGLAGAASALSIMALLGLAAHDNGLRGLAAMNAGLRAITLVDTLYSPTGAGKPYAISYRFHPRWRGFGAPTPTSVAPQPEKPATAARPR